MNEQTEELRESSRFYRLVQEVTARLVGARGEEIDAAVDDCLAWTGEHFGVDSVSLGGISKSGELTPALRVWGRLPSRNNSLALDPPPGPEMAAQFCREGSFVFPGSAPYEFSARYPIFDPWRSTSMIALGNFDARYLESSFRNRMATPKKPQ